ncbi:hypothetical protein BGZ95_005711 [Linnemannia exigua]|uniref:Uncharacterized protein n=1 Tax=Linnemannia exigua TaxID=604196 RepID=A0AAD4DIA1_9FUNG|nr:hypothetical protein BGZ95_005711 [Linnemannia exigua]
MKITFALSALLAMAATAVSASPTDVTLSPRAACTDISLFWKRLSPNNRNDPVIDLHAFELVVAGKYQKSIPFQTTSGNAKDNYKETRKSDDGLWTVTHTDRNEGPVTLKAKGKEYRFNRYNRGKSELRLMTFEYFHCIEW